MNDQWDLVRQFHVAFQHPHRETPKSLASGRVAARAAWMMEEVQEFVDATSTYEQADAMIDLIYFALGTLVEMGVRPANLFEIVHQANMAKIWPDGQPHFAPDGKTVKPPSWVDPGKLIADEIESQRDIDKI